MKTFSVVPEECFCYPLVRTQATDSKLKLSKEAVLGMWISVKKQQKVTLTVFEQAY